jgi:hypothetical protein
LARQDEDLVFVAYPLRISNNILYLYYSTRHWRKMVNGFSGFIPPLFREVMAKGRFFPSREAIRDFRDLGVDLIMVDTERYREKRLQRLQSTLGNSPDLQEIAVFDSTIVYRVKPRPSAAQPPTLSEIGLVPMSRADFSLRASSNVDSLSLAADGDRRTRWRSPMRRGEWLEIEWRETSAVAALQLDISGTPLDYPRGYRVESSEDGNRWDSVAQAQEFHPPILDFLEPNDFVLSFEWQPHRARFLRLVQTGESSAHPWSVAEVLVWFDPS